jgi:hypothetical protein
MVSFEAARRLTGDAIRGKEHLGRPTPPMGESAISACGCYMVARWIFVWDTKPESVCITRAQKIHAPPIPQLPVPVRGLRDF